MVSWSMPSHGRVHRAEPGREAPLHSRGPRRGDQFEQESARRWRASLHNNIGYALHQMGRFDEALVEFESALALRQAQGSAESIRVARWMVAWTSAVSEGSTMRSPCSSRWNRSERRLSDRAPYVFAELAGIVSREGRRCARR